MKHELMWAVAVCIISGVAAVMALIVAVYVSK